MSFVFICSPFLLQNSLSAREEWILRSEMLSASKVELHIFHHKSSFKPLRMLFGLFIVLWGELLCTRRSSKGHRLDSSSEKRLLSFWSSSWVVHFWRAIYLSSGINSNWRKNVQRNSEIDWIQGWFSVIVTWQTVNLPSEFIRKIDFFPIQLSVERKGCVCRIVCFAKCMSWFDQFLL